MSVFSFYHNDNAPRSETNTNIKEVYLCSQGGDDQVELDLIALSVMIFEPFWYDMFTN